MTRPILLVAVFLAFAITIVNASFTVNWYQSLVNNDVSESSRFSVLAGTTTASTLNFPDLTASSVTVPSGFSHSTYFALKAAAKLNIRTAGTYIFTITSDDGGSLRVNGKTLVAAWKAQSTTSSTGSVNLSAGSATLEVWYFQFGGGAALNLEYSGPDTGNKKVTIPDSSTTAIPVPPPYVTFLGTRYAALDSTPPSATTGKCQTTTITIPSGWSLATSSTNSKLAALSFSWGGVTCIGLSGGSSVPTSVATSTTSCKTSGAVTQSSSGVSTTVCRVLITQSADSLDDEYTTADYSTNFVTLQGNDYATLDAAPPTSTVTTNGCNSAYFQLPSGWSLVTFSSTPAVKLLLTGAWTFGATGVTDSSNVILDFTGTSIGTAVVDKQTATVGSSSVTLYRVKPSSLGCFKLLLRRQSSSGDSWDLTPDINSFINLPGSSKIIGALSNSFPTDKTSTCDNLPRALPAGYSLAKKDTTFINLINQKTLTFGADCLLFPGESATTNAISAPGKNAKCQGTSDVGTINYNNVDYYFVKNCTLNKRLLIQSVTTNLNPTAPCGTCYAWGDPHVQSLNRIQYNFYGVGEYVYLQPAATETQNYQIWTKQYPVSSAAANVAVHFTYAGNTIDITVNPTGPQGPSTFSYNGKVLTDVTKAISTTSFTSVSFSSSDNKYFITSANNLKLEVDVSYWNINMLDLYITVPNSLISKTTGICGACGVPDLPYGNGTKTNFTGGSITQSNDYGNTWPHTNTPTPAPTPATSGPTTTAAPATCGKPAVSLPPATEDAIGSTCQSPDTPYFKADNGDPYQVTLPAGYRFDYAYVKAGTSCIRSNINDNTLCYKTYLSGNTVTTSRVGTPSPNCQTISHVFFYATDCGTGSTTTAAPTPSPTPAPVVTTAPPSNNEIPPCEPSLLKQAQDYCTICLQSTDTTAILNCVIDVCGTTNLDSCKSTGHQCAHDNNNTVVVPRGDQCVDTTITNTVTLNGADFATLDNNYPTDNGLSAQTATIKLDDDWQVAPDIALVHGLISCYSFGSSCLVLSPLYGYTQGLSRCGGGINAYGNTTCLAPLPDNSRLLVIRKPAVSTDDLTITKATWSNGVTLVNNPRRPNFYKALNFVNSGTDVTGTYTLSEPATRSFSIGTWGAQTATAAGVSSSDFTVTFDCQDSTGKTVDKETAQFSLTSSFHYREVDITIPTGKSCTKIVATYSAPSKGTYYFTDHDTDVGTPFGAANLLSNPSCDNDASGWNNWNTGFQFTNSINAAQGEVSGAIKVSGLGTSDTLGAGAVQNIAVDAATAATTKSIYFRGESYTTGLSGSYPNGYSLYVDLGYTDGTSSWGIVAPFSVNTTSWQTAERTFKIPDGKTLKSVQFVALVRGLAGVAYFDNLYITLLNCGAAQTDTSSCSYGDPHILTLDNHYYDLYTVGDFLLYEDASLSITTRHCIQASATVNCASLINFNSTTYIQIERNRYSNAPYFLINGVQRTLINNVATNIGGVVSVTVTGSLTMNDNRIMTYDFVFPSTGHILTVTAHLGDYGDQWLQYYPRPPRSAIGNTHGLLGNFNGDPSDDYTDSLGTVWPITSNETVVYDIFAESWRVNGAPFVIMNSQNKVDPSVKRVPTKQISDFPQSDVDKAYQVCNGVALSTNCVLDFLLTGGDSGYISGYYTLESKSSGDQLTQNSANPSSSSSSSDDSKRNAIIILVTVIGGTVLIAVLILIGVVLYRSKVSVAN